MEGLENYKTLIDEMKIPPNNFKAIQSILADPLFNKEQLMTSSSAAGGLCDWL